MAHHRSNGSLFSGSPTPHSRHPISSVTAAFLTKLAKHLAVLACFAIVGHATGRFEASEVTIFFIVTAAALFHSAGHILQRRYAARPPSHRVGL
jgi:hypothetical protein